MTNPWIACQILDLTPYFNNDGISFDDNRGDGDFAGHRPDELPAGARC